MKFSDKNKRVLGAVKNMVQGTSWKYKGGGIFKKQVQLFFDVTFTLSRKEDVVIGCCMFKPYDVDDTFWDIIDASACKTKPLSFRADAAFCVRPVETLEQRVAIRNIERPEMELEPLLAAIDANVAQVESEVRGTEDYIAFLERDPVVRRLHFVGLVTAHLTLGRFERASELIEEAQQQKIHCGFSFENRQTFFDLAARYCISATTAPTHN